MLGKELEVVSGVGRSGPVLGGIPWLAQCIAVAARWPQEPVQLTMGQGSGMDVAG